MSDNTEQNQDVEGRNENDVSLDHENASSSEQPEVESEGERAEDFDPMAQLEADLSEANDKYVRLYSEFENFRRRTAQEKIDLIGNASGEIISDLLPVLDDFERALANNEKVEDIESIKEGFKLLHQKFNGIIKSKGLEEIDALNQDFDVDLHEAITKIPAPDKKLKNKVVDVVEKGYKLGDKVLRYSKVVIGE